MNLMNLGLPLDLTWYKLLTDWGSLIGGFFALIAGIVAYRAGLRQAVATRHAAEMQAEAQRRKYDHDVETVRTSIAMEVRQVIGRALGTHNSLVGLLTQTSGQITAQMVESSVGVAVPIVYPAVADRIALLKDEAVDVINIYQVTEIARDGARRLIHYRTPGGGIPLEAVAAVAAAFLVVCVFAPDILPRLKTGIARYDENDGEQIKQFREAQSAWHALKAVSQDSTSH